MLACGQHNTKHPWKNIKRNCPLCRESAIIPCRVDTSLKTSSAQTEQNILWFTGIYWIFLHLTFYLAFSRRFCPKPLTIIHTYIHALMAVVVMQAHQEQFGVQWGSCPRTLWHVDQGNQTSDLPITRHWVYPWAIAAPPHPNIKFNLPSIARHSYIRKTADSF